MTTFEQAVNDLVELALKHISHEYDKGGPHYRAYHNSTHTHNVIDSARDICKLATANNRISCRDAQLCILAAAFHDVVHNGDSDQENERLSAEFAAALMHTMPVFTKHDISHVQHMILATKCTQKYPKIIQAPLPHDYPAKLLCDADLASFGKPFEEFYASAMAYFHELYSPDPGNEQLHKFINVEKVLLEHHSFWTEEAQLTYPHAIVNLHKL